ncbi:MAG: permease-like cell division protein FtsX [Ilumatobacteraceae bacterium]
MLSRLGYAFRETWASFQRNITLTAAAILTAAVALLLAGATFLIQNSFSNMLAKWQDGVQLIVFVNPGAGPDQIEVLRQSLEENEIVASVEFYDQAKSFEQFQKYFAGQTSLLETMTADQMPSQLRVVPVEGAQELLPGLQQQYARQANVFDVGLASDTVRLYAKLSSFVRGVTIVASVVLLVVAVTLIWNTIRTAMFARRREIEVMKLVGATNWFIRIPFMLEGLLQGFIGALAACGGLFALNSLWTNNLKEFSSLEQVTSENLLALQVAPGYLRGVMIFVLVIGAVAGAIGSGVAASRFLDV